MLLTEMQWVANTLQLAIVVKSAGARFWEAQALQELNLGFGRITAHCGIAEKFPKTSLLSYGGVAGRLREFEHAVVFCRELPVEQDLQRKGLQVNVPRLDYGIQERGAVINGNVEHIRVQKLQYTGAHLLVRLPAQFGDATDPIFIFELIASNTLNNIKKLLSH